MSLNKAILYGKEHRKPYYHAKRFSRSCRNHGSCSYCLGNRLHSSQVKDFKTKEELKNFYKDEP